MRFLAFFDFMVLPAHFLQGSPWTIFFQRLYNSFGVAQLEDASTFRIFVAHKLSQQWLGVTADRSKSSLAFV